MKSNRMFGILCLLLEREKMTAQELADYFKVSVRTIHRDLLDLSGAGFPVTTQQGIGGGISLLPNFKNSKSVLRVYLKRKKCTKLEQLSSLEEKQRQDAAIAGGAQKGFSNFV